MSKLTELHIPILGLIHWNHNRVQYQMHSNPSFDLLIGQKLGINFVQAHEILYHIPVAFMHNLSMACFIYQLQGTTSQLFPGTPLIVYVISLFLDRVLGSRLRNAAQYVADDCISFSHLKRRRQERSLVHGY
jgi:hypothetical protein